MALIAFGSVAHLAFRENELHFYLAAAGAEELLRDDSHPCILAQYLSHMTSTSFRQFHPGLCIFPGRGTEKPAKFTFIEEKVKPCGRGIPASRT
jgi:hypothetical protein